MIARTLVHRLAMAALALACGVGAAESCAYHAISPNLTAGYPGSVSVALAVSAARRDGVLAETADPPAIRRLFGYGRAARDFRRLDEAMRSVSPVGAPGGISILLVEAGLWAWLDSGPQAEPSEIHRSGPKPGSVVVLMAEAALHPLVIGELPVEEAIDRGLLRIVGDQQPAVALLLANALGDGYARPEKASG